MPRVPPFDRPATYEDLVQVPDHMVAEILDGELHASPRPAPRHSIAASSLLAFIAPPYHQGRGGAGGWWILSEPELHFGDNVLVPDIAGWQRIRVPDIAEKAYVTVAPDWVCEVLSPSTATIDRAKKSTIYAAEKVRYAWLVDPIARTLEVLRLEDARWTIVATRAGSEVVRAEPFTDIQIELASLWID